MSSGIAAELDKILEEYGREVEQEAEAIMKDVAREAVSRLKKTSPRSKGSGRHYASGWATSKEGKDIVIYNKTKPGLTHLLEKGHATVRGGRVKGRAHIAPVEKWANAEVLRRIESKL